MAYRAAGLVAAARANLSTLALLGLAIAVSAADFRRRGDRHRHRLSCLAAARARASPSISTPASGRAGKCSPPGLRSSRSISCARAGTAAAARARDGSGGIGQRSKLAAVVGPVQQRLALARPAEHDRRGSQCSLISRDMAADRLPAFDLPRDLRPGMAAAQVIAAIPLETSRADRRGLDRRLCAAIPTAVWLASTPQEIQSPVVPACAGPRAWRA